MSRRGWLLALGGVLLVAVLVVLAPTPSPPYALTSTEPDGTDIMRRILVDGFDVDVVDVVTTADADGLDPRDVALVFEDRLGEVDEAAIAEHVASGGQAVVADPRSPLAGVEVVGPADLRGAPDCGLLPGTRVGPRPGPFDEAVVDTTFRAFVPPSGSTQVCWPDPTGDGGAYLAVVPDPSGGQTLVLGSPVALTNAMLANRSGTTALVPLLAPDEGGRLVVVRGDGAPPPGDEAPAGAVPQRLLDAMGLLVVAGVLYLLANARRLGRVLTQEPQIRVPAAELALGVADLLQRHGHAQHAADHVRAGLRADLDRMLGTAQAGDDDVVALLARTTGLDAADVRPAVASTPVAGDDDLLVVVAAVHRVRDHLGLAPRPTSTANVDTLSLADASLQPAAQSERAPASNPQSERAHASNLQSERAPSSDLPSDSRPDDPADPGQRPDA